jgi:alpha-galactosidase
MRIEFVVGLLLSAAFLNAGRVWAVEPSPDELATAQQWAGAAFGPAGPLWQPRPGIEVVSNHDPVHKNARFDKPMHLGDEEYTRGLFCHAPSSLTVHLPGPGKTFHAIIGVDLNEHTAGGQGSVVFSVAVSGKELFRSGVMRGKEPGVPVEIDLGGAQELILQIDDAGDGISCDQADWAEARVVLENGAEVWLADLPMAGGPAHAQPGVVPFSFVYGSKNSAELLPGWNLERTDRPLDDVRTERTLAWTDPASGLLVRCVAVEYRDYPLIEWTLYFKNTGTEDTPILENIQPLDLHMQRGDLGEFTLHHFRGSDCRADDFGPEASALAAKSVTRIVSAGGRSSNRVMPYFNVESTCRDGAIFAVGWPGQWAAEFARDEARGLHITAGQEQTHFKLLPGEEARTPLIALQHWKGDWLCAQNVWRRWIMAHGMTRPNGQPPAPQFMGCSSRAYEEMIKANTDTQKMFIDRYFEEGIPIDYWWMDAGWYVQQNGWPQVGTWEVDQKRFPGGLRPISDHAHAKGVKILVWFEPERVAAGTWLTEHHPEWILGGANGGLLDLGNPEAWQWLVNHIDRLITDEGIDLYRQDFNMDPLGLWRGHDAEDRQGITEIKHVTGLLAYWDELIRRHPGMLIDTCASGGRRVDLETYRRAVPLWRSDYAFEPVGHQGMTYGLSFWLPYHGTGTVACLNAPYYGAGQTPVESYAFWSNAAPSLNSGVDMRVREIDYPALRALVEQWRRISPFYYGDFYPLSKYSMDHDAWMAWQFDVPEKGEGMVQVFRRAESIYTAASLPLRGLEPQAEYAVSELPEGTPMVMTGRALMEQGLAVSFEQRPAAKVFIYTKASGK